MRTRVSGRIWEVGAACWQDPAIDAATQMFEEAREDKRGDGRDGRARKDVERKLRLVGHGGSRLGKLGAM